MFTWRQLFGKRCSDDAEDVARVLLMLERADVKRTHVMHESFNFHDPSSITRQWFDWPNALFTELVARLPASLTESALQSPMPQPYVNWSHCGWRDQQCRLPDAGEAGGEFCVRYGGTFCGFSYKTVRSSFKCVQGSFVDAPHIGYDPTHCSYRLGKCAAEFAEVKDPFLLDVFPGLGDPRGELRHVAATLSEN